LTLITEFIWIEIVYRKFPILATEGKKSPTESSERGGRSSGVVSWIKREKEDWKEFTQLPIFFSQYRS
jgi:hypothetical protein